MNKEKINERIKLNETKLDEINIVVNNLEKVINDYRNIYKKVIEINMYYGSENWFNDKENYENGKISNIKAGVLSEDGVWNLLEKIKELNEEMNYITDKIMGNDEDEF